MTTGSLAEAAQLVNYPRWIKKCMAVGAVYSYLLILASHLLSTSFAKDGLNRLCSLVLFFIHYGPTTFLLPVDPKAIDISSNCLHCNSSQ